jgi:poly-gamma-glutamate synthesis protein (capsule biosynthesis protein)
MIIVGDIASPTASSSDDLESIFRTHASIFSANALVCNFEGVISDQISTATNTPVLFNHSSVLKALKTANIQVAALANNHTLDLPDCFDETLRHFKEAGIAACGAGRSQKEASESIVFEERGVEIVLFNYCWDFLLYHQKNPSHGVYVSEIVNLSLIESIGRVRQEKPDARIVVYLHWSLDLEILPYPMYRKLSMELIDSGANLVVGTHSHCVQGGEKYKDGFIVYGLGNFFIPYHEFANGKLAFPEFSRLEMALEWDPISQHAVCHWFNYHNDQGHHWLELSESAPFEESLLLKKYSPYDQSFNDYVKYFRLNRRKKFLIPVFLDPKATRRNRVMTQLLMYRASFARNLAKMNIVKWQS